MSASDEGLSAATRNMMAQQSVLLPQRPVMLVDKTMRKKKANTNGSSCYETHRLTATSESLKVSVLGSPPSANVHVPRQNACSARKPRPSTSNTTFKFVSVSRGSKNAKARRSAAVDSGEKKSNRMPGKRDPISKDGKANERLSGVKRINGSSQVAYRTSMRARSPLTAITGSSKSVYGYGTGMDAAASAFLPFCE
jgi:hypothetical protein